MSTQSKSSEDLQDNGPKLLAIILTLRIVSFLVVCLRIWARAFVVKKIGAGDWCVIAATITSIALSVVSGMGIPYGTGRHIWVLPASFQVKADRLLYIDQVLYPATLGLTKISILLFYVELSAEKSFLRMIRLAEVCIITMTIALTFAFAFQCNPAAYAFDPEAHPDGTCVNKVSLNYTAAALNIVTDIWVLGIPLPMFLGLRCARRQKIIVIALFSLGGLTCIASIIRLKTLYALSTGTDKTWIQYQVVTWSALETSIGITTASIPFTKPLIDRYYPRFLNSLSGSVNMQSQRPSRLENGPGSYHMFSTSRRVDREGDLSERDSFPMETFKTPSVTDGEVDVIESPNWR